MVKWILPPDLRPFDVAVIRPKVSELIASENCFNAKYGLELALRLQLQKLDIFQSLTRPGKIPYLTLKLIANLRLSNDLLAVIYQQLPVWPLNTTCLGFDIQRANPQQFLQVVGQVGISPLLHCIVERERKVKLIAFQFLLEIDELFPFEDLVIVEAVMRIVDDPVCTEDAVRMIVLLRERYQVNGKESEFLAGISEFEEQLSDLELSSNEAVVNLVQALNEALMIAERG
jgi:hypothetical protein